MNDQDLRRSERAGVVAAAVIVLLFDHLYIGYPFLLALGMATFTAVGASVLLWTWHRALEVIAEIRDALEKEGGP